MALWESDILATYLLTEETSSLWVSHQNYENIEMEILRSRILHMLKHYEVLTPQEECTLQIEIAKIISNNSQDLVEKIE